MNEEHILVRLSHLLRDCSVGAIVRGSDSLVVVQDTRGWDRPGSDASDREIRYVERVRSALGIDRKLRSPPRAEERDGTVVGWIPALKFPTWMRCPKCGLLYHAPWRARRASGVHEMDSIGWDATSTATCPNCPDKRPGMLEQVPWVLVHEDGYLADVPWHDLAHRDAGNSNQRNCRPDWTKPYKPYLKLLETRIDRQVLCEVCGASATLSFGSLPRLPFPTFAWQQPWVREPPAKSPEASAWMVEINDVRVHSPDTCSALVIPPESRIRRGTVTDRLYGSTKSLDYLRGARNELDRKIRLRRIASEYRCLPEQIKEAIAEIDDGYPLFGMSVTRGDLLADEYRALVKEIPDLGEDEDFVTKHHTRDWKALGKTLDAGTAKSVVDAVSNVVSVNKLKEVMVLRGFRRAGGEKPTPPDITGECDCFPAIELFGEGIFFTLDEAKLRDWEDVGAFSRRADSFSERYVRRGAQGNSEFEIDVTARFLLCHTLAHLFIRQLDAEAGYPAASLKERIYCSGDKSPMAGILIYVAVPDEEGSLGGLMELARPERFLRLLTGAFEAANWCSLDPVCAEREGHGVDLLNGAACHACALVPETSCAFGNVLLDRTFVKGAGPQSPSFLDFVRENK